MEALILRRAKHILAHFRAEPTVVNSYCGHYFKDMTIKDGTVQNGEIKLNFLLPATPFSKNYYNTVTVGSLLTIIDQCTTLAILAGDKGGRHTVSASLNINCARKIPIGSNMLIETHVRRIGKTTAFSECSFFNADEKEKKMLAFGTHLKACIDSKFPIEFKGDLSL